MVGKAARDRLDVRLAWGHVRAAAGLSLAGQLRFREPVRDDRLDRAVGQQGEGFEALVHVHTHALLRVQHVPDARMIDLEGHARDHVARGGRDVGRAALPAAGPVVEGQPMVEQEDGRDGAQVGGIRIAVTAELRPVLRVKVGPIADVHHAEHTRRPHFNEVIRLSRSS